MRRTMRSSFFYINFLRKITSTFLKRNPYYVATYVFLRYTGIKLQKLLKMNLYLVTLPEKTINQLIDKYYACETEYIDPASCVLVNVNYLSTWKATWFYICCKRTHQKYKVLAIPSNDVGDSIILISENMKYNIENAIPSNVVQSYTYCMFPVEVDTVSFASEVKVSLISNPYDCTNQLASSLLKNYFHKPRFLRPNDIFGIDPKEYAQIQFYSCGSFTVPTIYFKVTSLKCANKADANTGCFIVYGETTLIQEANMHSYLPRKHTECLCTDSLLSEPIKQHFMNNCPPNLMQHLEDLETCILPFMKRDVRLHIKPVFLLRAPSGCGKHKLIQMCSERLGLHLLNVDFAEVQALTSAQTEAKLRIVLHNAEQTMPCIVFLDNVQVFGKNFEGQKDERTISAFKTEIDSLYEKNLEFPIIIIASSDGSELQAELQRLFIETIDIEFLDQSKRTDLITWLLESKGLSHRADVSSIAGLCSDYKLADFDALITHAIKFRCKSIAEVTESCPVLTQDDFVKAYEYMQSIYSDSKGAPRVPKVYWDDIGGLADLKEEIVRRIKLPLLNAFGFGQSGLLLYGPPGTGKTLLAKAVATEYQLHFLSVKGPEVLNMYVGQSEKNVRQIFERARAAAPCIIFFDELDSLAPNRGRNGDSGGVMDRVVSQLLAEMDGLEDASSIFIIGATNRPDLIDPALLRPGRFDKMLYVGIHSDRASQLSVLKALTRKFKLLKDGRELEELLQYLPENVTGADLYAVCSDAWLHAARRVLIKNAAEETNNVNKGEELLIEDGSKNVITVKLEDFIDATRQLVPSVSKEEAKKYEKLHKELSSR